MRREASCACGALGVAATGEPLRLSLCPCVDCKRRTGMVSIPAGGFADASFPGPAVEVYEERRCPWLPELGIAGEP